GDSGAAAVIDTLIGGDVRAAVAGVARWRKCQLVVTHHHPTNPWLRWLRTSMPAQLLGLADSLALLALRGTESAKEGPPPTRKPSAAEVGFLPAKDVECTPSERSAAAP